jgi:hypothetical protein
MITDTRRLRASAAVTAVITILAGASSAMADPTPSTNDDNRDLGWAHVNAIAGPGFAMLEFVSTRGFASCFEYRTDGDTSQAIADDNYNSDITDGLYPFTCVNNSTDMTTLFADEFVEVRMVFGAESDERFDWTRFDVGGKETCKNGGYEDYGFRNQGQCIRFVNTGKDSRD